MSTAQIKIAQLAVAVMLITCQVLLAPPPPPTHSTAAQSAVNHPGDTEASQHTCTLIIVTLPVAVVYRIFMTQLQWLL